MAKDKKAMDKEQKEPQQSVPWETTPLEISSSPEFSVAFSHNLKKVGINNIIDYDPDLFKQCFDAILLNSEEPKSVLDYIFGLVPKKIKADLWVMKKFLKKNIETQSQEDFRNNLKKYFCNYYILCACTNIPEDDKNRLANLSYVLENREKFPYDLNKFLGKHPALPIHQVAHEGKKGFFEELVKHGAELTINCRSENKSDAIDYAFNANESDSDIVKYCLNLAKKNNIEQKLKSRIIEVAMCLVKISLVKEICEGGYCSINEIESFREEYVTAIEDKNKPLPDNIMRKLEEIRNYLDLKIKEYRAQNKEGKKSKERQTKTIQKKATTTTVRGSKKKDRNKAGASDSQRLHSLEKTSSKNKEEKNPKVPIFSKKFSNDKVKEEHDKSLHPFAELKQYLEGNLDIKLSRLQSLIEQLNDINVTALVKIAIDNDKPCFLRLLEQVKEGLNLQLMDIEGYDILNYAQNNAKNNIVAYLRSLPSIQNLTSDQDEHSVVTGVSSSVSAEEEEAKWQTVTRKKSKKKEKSRQKTSVKKAKGNTLTRKDNSDVRSQSEQPSTGHKRTWYNSKDDLANFPEIPRKQAINILEDQNEQRSKFPNIWEVRRRKRFEKGKAFSANLDKKQDLNDNNTAPRREDRLKPKVGLEGVVTDDRKQDDNQNKVLKSQRLQSHGRNSANNALFSSPNITEYINNTVTNILSRFGIYPVAVPPPPPVFVVPQPSPFQIPIGSADNNCKNLMDQMLEKDRNKIDISLFSETFCKYIEANEINIEYVNQEKKFNILHVAAATGYTQVMRAVIEKYPTTIKNIINACDNKGNTPLDIVVYNEYDPDFQGTSLLDTPILDQNALSYKILKTHNAICNQSKEEGDLSQLQKIESSKE